MAEVFERQPVRRRDRAITVGSLAVLLAAGIVGAVLYPSLPSRLATHWDGAGRVDGWAQKSFWSAFGVLLIGLALVVGFAVLGRYSDRLARFSSRPGSTAESRALLGWLQPVLAVVVVAASALIWAQPVSPLPALIVFVGILVLVIGTVVVFLVRLSWPARR